MHVYLISLCFLFSVGISPICCSAEEAVQKPMTAIEAVDFELVILHKQLSQARLKSMQKEINGQQLMFEEWSSFAKEIKESEEYEEQADQIQKQIEALESKRTLLLQQKKP